MWIRWAGDAPAKARDVAVRGAQVQDLHNRVARAGIDHGAAFTGPDSHLDIPQPSTSVAFAYGLSTLSWATRGR